ncbi:hypothetical protein BRE01_62220 [Brevibacillus reuszeri]|uniref:Uncharacterized protein n=1 Tax=Brevibacillus reuszeri TaxID=54915 RepID=A0ABQ0TXI0_9BACL|nr:hypothetical protein BRE01_62220 [Brevibacillus reuszeri]
MIEHVKCPCCTTPLILNIDENPIDVVTSEELDSQLDNSNIIKDLLKKHDIEFG